MAEQESNQQQEKIEQEHEEDAELKGVASTMVAEWAWDQGILEVVFQNGHEETYNVDESTWHQLRDAPSAGKAMWTYVL